MDSNKLPKRKNVSFFTIRVASLCSSICRHGTDCLHGTNCRHGTTRRYSTPRVVTPDPVPGPAYMDPIADTAPIVYTVPSQIRYRLFTRYPCADTALIADTVLTADIAPIAFFELRRFLVSLVLQRLLGLAVQRYLICCWTTNYNLLFPFFPSLFFLCTPKITHIFFVNFFCCDFTQITRLFCPLSVVEICYDSYIFANELVFRDCI